MNCKKLNLSLMLSSLKRPRKRDLFTADIVVLKTMKNHLNVNLAKAI